MKIIEHNKTYSFKKGVSSDAVYICGNKKFTDKLIEEVKHITGLTCLLNGDPKSINEWDLAAIQDCDVAAIELSTDLSLLLIPFARFAQFTTQCLIYHSGENTFMDLIIDKFDAEKFSKLSEISAEIKKSFAYLDFEKIKSTIVKKTTGIGKKRGRPKKEN